MSEGWERRLAAATIAQAFEDLVSTQPGRDRDDTDDPRLRRRRGYWRRAWLAAAEWCFTPEAEEDRRHWFAQAGLPMPETSEGMVAAVQRYAAGPVLDDDTEDDPEEDAQAAA